MFKSSPVLIPFLEFSTFRLPETYEEGK